MNHSDQKHSDRPLGEIALSDFEKKRAVNCSLDFPAIVITQKYRIDQ